MSQFSNEKLINFANNIDNLSLSDDINNFGPQIPTQNINNYGNNNNKQNYDNNYNKNNNHKNGTENDSNIIKTLTSEIRNDLKNKNNEYVKREIYENELNNIDGIDNIDFLEKFNDNNSTNSSGKKNNNGGSNSNNDNVYSIFTNISIKNFIILFSLYFLLSQEMVKDSIASYFTCLNPDKYGKVNMSGVILYGLILSVLYFVIINLI